MPATNSLLQEGRYRIGHVFPNAGNNCVYEAYDTVSETNVVVKEVPSVFGGQSNDIKDEARSLTGIDHDSLLRVTDFFSETGKRYLVMEWVDGDDLFQLLERNANPFPLSDVTAWADQLLDAVNYLHSFQSGIVHADICPANINLSSTGRIKLQAFGIANHSEVDFNTTISASTGIAEEINYSPLEKIWSGLDAASQKVIISRYDERSERILKEPLDARSDIYSIGATLYHLMTARRPIDALERSIEILEGKADPLLSPNKIDKTVPPEISDVIMKAMEIKREYRFDSAAIMRQVLKTAVIRVKEREALEARAERAEEPTPVKTAAAFDESFDDDLLGIHTPPSSMDDGSDMQTAKLEPNTSQPKNDPVEGQATIRPAETEKAAVAEPPPAIFETQSKAAPDNDVSFLEPEAKSGSKFSLPIAAAAAVVVIAAAIGGWFMLSSGSSETPRPAEVKSSNPSMPNTQPDSRIETPDAVKNAPTTASTSESEPAVPVATAPDTSVRTVQRPSTKQKTPERPTAKPVPQKKQVTVDDLINDN